jgi:hypothetical protein
MVFSRSPLGSLEVVPEQEEMGLENGEKGLRKGMSLGLH